MPQQVAVKAAPTKQHIGQGEDGTKMNLPASPNALGDQEL